MSFIRMEGDGIGVRPISENESVATANLQFEEVRTRRDAEIELGYVILLLFAFFWLQVCLDPNCFDVLGEGFHGCEYSLAQGVSATFGML